MADLLWLAVDLSRLPRKAAANMQVGEGAILASVRRGQTIRLNSTEIGEDRSKGGSFTEGSVAARSAAQLFITYSITSKFRVNGEREARKEGGGFAMAAAAARRPFGASAISSDWMD
jgi:hypothetical protein